MKIGIELTGGSVVWFRLTRRHLSMAFSAAEALRRQGRPYRWRFRFG